MISPIESHTKFWPHALVIGAMMLATALIEHALGRRLISESGRVFFWVSQTNSPENSQQVSDWYSFSHIIHGFAFYALLRWIFRERLSIGARLTIATLIEVSWEILENTPLIINRYRAGTIAVGYYGDSILNSMCDISFAIIGFLLASRLPVWVTIALVIVMEVGVGYAIHDNLFLNIVMLIYPFEKIRRWQGG